MAKASIGPRIGVDGEAEYRAQIKQIIEQAKTLDAQMGAVTASFDKNTTAEEKAAKTSGILAQQLETAEKRADLLRDMVEKSAAATGENSEATLKWKQALFAAEEQVNSLRVKDQETTETIDTMGDAMEKSGKKSGGLGDQISGLADKLGVSLPRGATDALNGIKGFSTGTVAALGAVVAGVAAVELAIKAVKLGIEEVQKLHQMTLEQGKWADDLLTRSAQTGIDTTTLQQLDYAAKFLDFDGIDKSLVKLTSSMDKARSGAETQAVAFQTLGVSVVNTDGSLRDNWTTFMESIDALGRIQNATERDALANDLFGKSYSDLKPLIDAGSEGLQEFMDKAVEAGYVLDESQVQKLGEVDDAYQEYQTQLETTKKKLALEFAPISQEVMGAFGDIAMQAGDKLIESGILEKLDSFIEPLGEILGALLELGGTVLPLLEGPLQLTADLFSGLASAISWTVDMVNTLITAWQNVDWGSISAMNNSADYGFGINAAGTDYWRGGLTWVGESGRELVDLPRGSRIYSNQQSQRIVGGGDTVYNITVANVEELDEIVEWYESRQIRGRMK